MSKTGDIEVPVDFELIVTIVEKNRGHLVLETSMEAGAEGGTILRGRGTGIHEKAKIFGLSIDPEKEIVLTLVPVDISNEVFSTIIREANLDSPGRGLCFVVDVKKLGGVCHLMDYCTDSNVKFS